MLFYTNIQTYFDFSNYLCKNIIFYTMEIFSDLKQYAQVQSFKSRLNKKYNCNLDNGDLHYIFEKLNIPFSMMNVRGMNVKYYKRDAVIDAFYRGLLTKEIENLTHNREKTNIRPTFQTPGYGKSIVVNTGNRYYPKNNDNTTEDEYDYPNGENDMEKYSNYLINNVYEGKRNMNKITINENDIKQMVNESVRKILKESYNNPNVVNYTTNIRNKVRDYLYKMEDIFGDDMGNNLLNEVFDSGLKFLTMLNAYIDDNNQQEIYKY